MHDCSYFFKYICCQVPIFCHVKWDKLMVCHFNARYLFYLQRSVKMVVGIIKKTYRNLSYAV